MKPRFWLILILSGYLLLAVGFGAINPLFEAPDEHHHYFTTQYVADNGRLPVIDPDNEWVGQEAAQPPLYYVLGSLLIRPIEMGAAEDWLWLNPFVLLGDASWPNNQNAFVHTAQENWPWRGPALAAHVLRLFSAALGLGTLLCIYGAARLIWPDYPDRWLLATAVVAFLPQFVFLHGAVTNDALIIFLCAAGLWQLLWLWRPPITDGRPPMTNGRLLLLGVTAGLAALTKTAGLLLILYSGFALLLFVWRDGRWRDVGRVVVYFLLPVLALSGWLYLRNWLLYGDPTAANQFVAYFGGSREYTLLDALRESGGLWLSFFAVFGWFNVRPPDWIYWVWHGVALTAIVGAITNYQLPITNYKLPAFLRWPGMVGLLLFGWLLLVYAGLLRFMMLTPAAQGRLLFPAILPLALAVAYGLSCWRRPWLTAVVPALALLTSLFSLFVVIPGAYAPPQPVALGSWPQTAVILNHDLGRGVELLAVDIETTAVRPGDPVWLTIYSRRNAPPPAAPNQENAPELVVNLFGAETRLAGKLHTYHGRGLYPANFWSEGEIYADRLRVDVELDIVVPTELSLYLNLLDEASGVRVGALKATPAQWPPAPPERLAQFGEGVELTAAHFTPQEAKPGDPIRLAATWAVTAAPGRDLTVFFHLGDPTAPPLAQGDSPPRGGGYPTRYWAAGETFDDWYEMRLPEGLADGRYPLWLGFYDPLTGERLPVWRDGVEQPFAAFPLGYVAVKR